MKSDISILGLGYIGLPFASKIDFATTGQLKAWIATLKLSFKFKDLNILSKETLPEEEKSILKEL